jgi:hypothetical protein
MQDCKWMKKELKERLLTPSQSYTLGAYICKGEEEESGALILLFVLFLFFWLWLVKFFFVDFISLCHVLYVSIYPLPISAFSNFFF